MRLIDADVLIEKFNEKADMAECLIDEKTAERFATFCALADAVEQMPTVDAVPVVHGRWINAPLCGNAICRCSVCGYMVNIHANLSGQIMQKFCTNCGATMDEKEDAYD